jgi:hypothetical protein
VTQLSAAHSVQELGNAGLTSADLVNSLLGGSGINLLSGTVSYAGANIASGLFSGAGTTTGIPFSSGVLLTSGSVYRSIGPNTVGDNSQNNNVGGSSLLEAVTGLGGTQDASLLSFDFTSSLSSFSFQYAFGSEEYDEYVNTQFNDSFAFILQDLTTGASAINLAVIGNSPVSINTVNNGSNPSYYQSNNGPAVYDLEYDGLAGGVGKNALYSVGNVVVGHTNRISLVIADRGDGIYDSGVFLKAGSFVAGTAQVPEAGT